MNCYVIQVKTMVEKSFSRPQSKHMLRFLNGLFHQTDWRYVSSKLVHDRQPSPFLPRGRMVGIEQTLQQTYFPREVQVAFKVLMTHWILQFA